MSRIPLSDALLDVLSGLAPDVGSGARLTGLDLDLPLEVDVATRDGELVFLAHPRRWRLATVFDERPGRLSIRFGTADRP